MANGDYWNRGRREGLQRNTSMDAIDRIIGTLSNVSSLVQSEKEAKRRAGIQERNMALAEEKFEFDKKESLAKQVQQQRKTRATYLQNSMKRIMGDTGNPKYRKGNLSDEELKFYENQLEQFKPMVMDSDIDTMDAYSFYANDLKMARQSKEEYGQLSTQLEEVQNDLLKALDKQEEQQDAIGTAGSDDAYNELNDILTKWANINQRVYFEHEDKIGVDKPFSNRLKSVQTSLGYAMSEIIGNDKRTTPEQYEAMTQTLMTGNPVFVENFTKAQQTDLDNKMFNLNRQANEAYNDIEKAKNDIDNKYKDILIDPSSPNFEEQIKEEYENKARSSILGQLDINPLELSFDSVKQQYRDAYQELHRPVKDAEAKFRGINAEYKSVNPKGTGVPGLVENKDMKTGPLPIEIVDDINNNIVKKVFKKNPLLKDLDINNMIEAQAVVKNMLSGKSPAEQKNIMAQYNRAFREIDAGLKKDKRLQEANRAGIDLLYNNKVQILKRNQDK